MRRLRNRSGTICKNSIHTGPFRPKSLRSGRLLGAKSRRLARATTPPAPLRKPTFPHGICWMTMGPDPNLRHPRAGTRNRRRQPPQPARLFSELVTAGSVKKALMRLQQLSCRSSRWAPWRNAPGGATWPQMAPQKAGEVSRPHPDEMQGAARSAIARTGPEGNSENSSSNH
jgi:hypothetical protein